MEICDLEAGGIAQRTCERFARFNKLRGQARPNNVIGQFWDYVILTAMDDAQKQSYEFQLKTKLERKELPLSATYVVFADPPGAKIGNGGATLFAINELTKEFGMEVLDKKIIIVHAGGFSQRLPNASILGKVFLGVPVGNPMYQSLELKLASYVDFPQKIISGGIFVCSADTLEVYDDHNTPWTFSSDGFTALAHLSPLSVGETHGVFVLDQPLNEDGIVWGCRKFLHKPNTQKMIATPNCIVHEKGKEKWVMTDSAFFISKHAALTLLDFYETASPLSCEIDAYGDFLQALGRDSSPDYTKNVENVCAETETLVETRLHVYRTLKELPLYAIVLSSLAKFFEGKLRYTLTSSIFYHLGTMPEYKHHFCSDETFRVVVGVSPLVSCYGIPYRFRTRDEARVGSLTNTTKQGTLYCSLQHDSISGTSCIMRSIIQTNVCVGAGSVIEYCKLGQGVKIGSECVLSNCHLPNFSAIPDRVFMYGTAILVKGETLYVTIIFEIGSNLKKALPVHAALTSLTYFGRPLKNFVSQPGSHNSLGLWNAKLFPAARTMKGSCEQACGTLNSVLGNVARNTLHDHSHPLYSMKDILLLKDTEATLIFRESLAFPLQQRTDSVLSSQLNTCFQTRNK